MVGSRHKHRPYLSARLAREPRSAPLREQTIGWGPPRSRWWTLRTWRDFSPAIRRRKAAGTYENTRGISNAAAAALLISVASCLARADEPAPRSSDPRVVIEQFAGDPDIVTPTGLAVDARGRVLVVECHTHFPPEGYAGPTSDRLRWLLDTDDDGRADRFATFYEGTRATMGVAFGNDGWVYVATRNEIFRIRDTDADEQADERQPLVRLETQGNYPHNGLSGFAFDFRGGVYFGLGENLGADYRLLGADGQVLAGGGEGGSIYHCQADGSKLLRVATGFWNPFHLAVDPWERLFAVDNDPDSRPPCRLLQVVPGGDYGYRYRNGRKGLHPFTAWNGELPGTLPMLAGTGEAPSGVLVYESAALPEEYRGEILVTSWGDHRIDRFRPETRGASLRATAQEWISGGEDFRPVGIAVAPDGSLFVSDWVDRSYELHGRGAVWRIRPADRVPAAEDSDSPLAAIHSADQQQRDRAALALASAGSDARRQLADLLVDDPDARVRAAAWKGLLATGPIDSATIQRALADQSVACQSLVVRTLPEKTLGELAALAGCLSGTAAIAPELRAEVLRRAPPAIDRAMLLSACGDRDPFIQAAALAGLGLRCELSDWLTMANSDAPHERLASVWLLQTSDETAAHQVLPRLLRDADPQVRFAAIAWVAGRRLTEFRPQLVSGLATGGMTRQLFEGYLAALEQLDAMPPQIEGVSTEKPFVPPVRDVSGQDYIAQLLTDDKIAPELRRRALRMLDPAHPLLAGDQLKHWLATPDPALQLEAIRSLRQTSRDDRAALLTSLAADGALDEQLRAEAIVGLSPTDPSGRELLLKLAADSKPALRHEALRALRGAPLTAGERKLLDEHATPADGATAALVALLRQPAAPLSPTNAGSASSAAATRLEDWLSRLEGPADASAGERIFLHPQGPLCYRCHQIDGRGGRVGPDLTNTPQALTRRRLIESIVDPDKEIAPQFVMWNLAKTDGTTASGVLISEAADGAQTYADVEGRQFTLRPDEISQRSPQPTSVMPAGLVQRMTVQEFRDLLAYLLQRRE